MLAGSLRLPLEPLKLFPHFFQLLCRLTVKRQEEIAEESKHRDRQPGHDEQDRQDRHRNPFDILEPLIDDIHPEKATCYRKKHTDQAEVEEGVCHLGKAIDRPDDLIPSRNGWSFVGVPGRSQ